MKNLHALGYKTFSKWWDEGYDDDDPGTSWFVISQIVDQLSKKTSAELYAMIQDMQDILEHNRWRFLEMCKRA